tara:strand:- start:1137 stop:1574 length:438 start_codon:yes stop_codon:yes gene_type:complete
LKKNIDINIVLLNKEAKLPKKQHELDIGYDLYSLNSYELLPNIVTRIETGICIELPQSFAGFILPRSGLASKHSITSINSPGLVDPGYTGEIIIPLINHSKETYILNKGERFAQLVVINVENINFNIVNELDETDRSDKGFGSTG